MSWWDFVSRTSGKLNKTEIASLMGVHPSQLSRWEKGGSLPKAENAIAYARSVGASPVEALYELGLLRKDELGRVVDVLAGVGEITNEELVREIADRLGVKLGGRRGA